MYLVVVTSVICVSMVVCSMEDTRATIHHAPVQYYHDNQSIYAFDLPGTTPACRRTKALCHLATEFAAVCACVCVCVCVCAHRTV
jgi:hypothetical protein